MTFTQRASMVSPFKLIRKTDEEWLQVAGSRERHRYREGEGAGLTGR